MKNKAKIMKVTKQVFDISVFVIMMVFAIGLTIFYITPIVISFSFTGVDMSLFSEHPALIYTPILTIALVTGFAIYLFRRRKQKRKNPNLLYDEAMEAVDERGIGIAHRAKSMTLRIVIGLLLAASLAAMLLGHFAVSYIAFGIVCVSVISVFIFSAYYSKKM